MPSIPNDPRPLVMTVLGGGGFTFETSCLFRDLADRAVFVYLAPRWAGTPGQDDLPAGDLHLLPDGASISRHSQLNNLRQFVAVFTRALTIFSRRRVELVVTIGCSASIPLLIAARLVGCRTIFIESMARADRLSATGRFVYRMRLAQTFVVQWPALGAQFPRATVGSLL